MREALRDRRGTNGLIAVLERELSVFREVLGDWIVERELPSPTRTATRVAVTDLVMEAIDTTVCSSQGIFESSVKAPK